MLLLEGPAFVCFWKNGNDMATALPLLARFLNFTLGLESGVKLKCSNPNLLSCYLAKEKRTEFGDSDTYWSFAISWPVINDWNMSASAANNKYHLGRSD